MYGFDPVILIDTHTHLYLREFNDDREEVVKSALDRGIARMLMPNVDFRTLQPMLRLADAYPGNCLPMIGLHPTSVKDTYREDIGRLQEELGRRKYWGIGETGIDLYWDKSRAKQQEDSFRQHIALAKQTGLPIVIHARNSFDELFRILDREADESLRGVFHAFTGNYDQAGKILEYSFMLGIGGIVTFKNAGLDAVVAKIDPRHLVLETDAPYLSPVPFRGRRNEPEYLIYTLEKLAEIYSLPPQAIAGITTQNAATLFNIKI